MQGTSFAGTQRYEIRRRIGGGGMGVVYEAFDRERQAIVALKTLTSASPRALFRFKQEFRALSDVQHPNLVALYELARHEDDWFFTMELVRGGEFLDHVRGPGVYDTHAPTIEVPREPEPADSTLPTVRLVTPGPALDHDAATADGRAPRTTPALTAGAEARLRRALVQLVHGIDAIHGAGYLHRDLKPSNVLVEPGGRVAILDFGIVSSLGRRGERNAVVGTPAYMAPELLDGRMSPAADWYSLGVMLYEALTGGALPFTGARDQLLHAKRALQAPSPRVWCANVSEDLDALCAELLERDPDRRPDAAAILARLGEAPPPRAPTRTAPKRTATEETLFVGRTRELEELEHLRARVAPGHAVAVLVHGESGIGKSELMRQFVRAPGPAADGALVLWGRCHEREDLPFKGFDRIADALTQWLLDADPDLAASVVPDGAALLLRMFPCLGRVEAFAAAPVHTGPSKPQEERRHMFRAFRELLERLAERRNVIVCIDDLQWADADSVALLGDLLRPPGAPSLLFVATMRHGGVTASEIREAVSRGAEVHVLELAPLPTGDAAALVDRMAPGLAATLRDDVLTGGRGHPFFLRELARHAEAHGDGSAGSIDDALAGLWRDVPEPSRRVLEVLAVAGAPTPQRVVRIASETAADDFGPRVTALRLDRRIHIAGTRADDVIDIYHDRMRDALLARLDPDIRRAHHARLARALEETGAGETRPAQLVHHFAAAGENRLAATHAWRAANRAAHALAFDLAAEMYERVEALGDPARDRAELRRRRAEALENAGRGAEAAAAWLLAAEMTDGDTRLDCERRAAEQYLITGHLNEGRATLTRLLGHVGISLPDERRHVLASLLWRRARLRVRGVRWTPRTEREIPAIDLIRADLLWAVAEGLGAVDTVRGAECQTRALMLALRLGEPIRVGRSLALESAFLATQGIRMEKRARRLLDEARGVARRTGSAYLRGINAGTQAFLDFFCGRFADAAANFATSERILSSETVGTAWGANLSRAFRVQSLRLAGELADMRPLYEEYLGDAVRRGDRYTATTLRRVSTLLWLADDDPERVREELAGADWNAPVGDFHVQHWYELEARAELALYEGRAAAALDELDAELHRLRRSLLMRVRTIWALGTWLRARLLVAATDRDRPLPAAVARAARRLRAERVSYAAVPAMLLRAAVFRRADDTARAAAELHRAADAGTAQGVHMLAACARWRLAELLDDERSTTERDRANAWMRDHGVVRPERFVEVVVPF